MLALAVAIARMARVAVVRVGGVEEVAVTAALMSLPPL